MTRLFSKLSRWGGVPAFLLALAFCFPTKAEAQQHYESVSESKSIGNSKFGAGLDMFAEFKHTQTKVRAFAEIDVWAKFFGQQITVINGEALSQVNNGTSTNKVKLKAFGTTLINQNDPLHWQWSQNYFKTIANPLNYSFPIFWGVSVNIGCEMESGISASMKIGVASVVGAGLDGSVGPKVEVELYAAIQGSLIVVKAQVALTATFTLFDYSLNIDATISPYGAYVTVFTQFKPLSVVVELVLRYKTWQIGPWYAPWNGSWSGWKVKKSWTLWSWSLANIQHVILSWNVTWGTPHVDPIDIRHIKETSAGSEAHKKRAPKRFGKRAFSKRKRSF